MWEPRKLPKSTIKFQQTLFISLPQSNIVEWMCSLPFQYFYSRKNKRNQSITLASSGLHKIWQILMLVFQGLQFISIHSSSPQFSLQKRSVQRDRKKEGKERERKKYRKREGGGEGREKMHSSLQANTAARMTLVHSGWGKFLDQICQNIVSRM